VTGSNFVKLVVFAGIDHFTYQVVSRGLAEDSERSVESPTRSVFCQHVCIYRNVASDKGGQLPNGISMMLSSTDGKEDVRCLAKLQP
jgi:hypothetical protein